MENYNLTGLIEKARSHDNEAIEQIVSETRSKLYFIALNLVNKDADAQDVLQNSYIKAFSSLNSLKDDAKFEAWITKIVINTAYDFMSKASNRYDVKFTDMQCDDDLEFDVADDKIENQPELAFSKKETERIVKEIIDSLSDEQRVAVLMYFYNGMTTKEIAEKIGCKEVTIKARIRYAKEKIKESVEIIQKRDGIKLYNMAPLPFFLCLLKGYAESGFGVATTPGAGITAESDAATSGAATTTPTTGIATKAVATGGIKTFIGSVVGKIAIVCALAVGVGVVISNINNHEKGMSYTKTEPNGESLKLENDTNDNLDGSTSAPTNNGYASSQVVNNDSQSQNYINKDVMSILKENDYSFTSTDGLPCHVIASNGEYEFTFVNCQYDGNEKFRYEYDMDDSKIGWGVYSNYFYFSYEEDSKTIFTDGVFFDPDTYEEKIDNGVFNYHLGWGDGASNYQDGVAKQDAIAGNDNLNNYLDSLGITKEDLFNFVTSNEYLNY